MEIIDRYLDDINAQSVLSAVAWPRSVARIWGACWRRSSRQLVHHSPAYPIGIGRPWTPELTPTAVCKRGWIVVAKPSAGVPGRRGAILPVVVRTSLTRIGPLVEEPICRPVPAGYDS